MQKTLVLGVLAASAALGALAGCSSPAKKKSGTVTITLDRAAGSHDIGVTMHVLDAAGAPETATAPSLSAIGGTASAVSGGAAGNWTATVTPDALDTEVEIDASAGGATAKKIALPFTTVDAAFGQPEAIDGLVNSPGWEDGANVSPDGQWLIVASYVPLDLLTCSIAGLAPTDPSCTTILGPYTAPMRPDMLGASRIHGTTFDNICPSFGVTTPPTNFTFVPVAAYGFHRQTDGSFGEPFVIGFEADGCLGPYGYSFTAPPSGTSASVVFANHDPLAGGSGSDADVYYTPLTLGQKNILGTYQVVGGSVQVSGYTPVLIPPQLPTRQGNPAFSNGRLYWDDEDLAAADRDLYFSDLTGTLPNVTATSAQTLGVSQAGIEDIQPSTDGADLYWMSAGGILRATLTSAGNPALPGSWTAKATVLGPAASAPILAIGEPTIARVGGKRELYFVYIKKTPSGGYDANVGRVRER